MSIKLPFLFGSPAELGGQAIDGKGDSHLTPDIHVRFAPSPDLGLPSTPIQVVRLSLGPGDKWPGVRTDIAWVNSSGDQLTPPFKVTPGNPVRGYLTKQAGAACCWLRIEATPDQPDASIFPRNPPIISRALSGTRRRTSGVLGSVAAAAASTRISADASALIPGSFRARAFMMTEVGPAEVARRSRVPFELAATPIDWIEVSGSGTVHRVHWLDGRGVFDEFLRRASLPATDPQTVTLWRTLSMPVSDSVRYTGAPPDSLAQANDRAKEGAPLRFGLHDVPDVNGPAASPAATPADEAARLDDITPQLREYLQKLVSTLTPETLVDQVLIPPSDGTFDIPLLAAVLQALGDPSVARWTGHAVVDREPPSTTVGNLIAYGVFGTWAILEQGRLRAKRLGTVVCAVVGHPGDRPLPPGFDEPISGPFLTATPPDSRRLVTLNFHDLLGGAGLAVARRLGSAVSSLNKRAPSGRAIAFLPGVDDEAIAFGDASITDRVAPPDALVYRSAQQDWFGRWSEWVEREVAAAIRPLPPAPVLNAVYQVPAVPDPIPNGLLSGTISVEVPVPPVASLPTGGFLLDYLELTVDGTPQELPIANPTSPPALITQDLPGPGIERAGQRTITLVARWVDQAGQRSAPSAPKTLVLNDPRSAAPVSFPPGLRYTSRPDATGHARFRLQWVSGPGQAFFRVFYTDEVRLRRALSDLVDQGGTGATSAANFLGQVESTSNPAERAAIFEDARTLFGKKLFEQITSQPLVSPSVNGVMTFDHAVSGSLQTLSFYRIVSVTRAQVEASFEQSGLLPVRVPNTLAPSQPTLSLRPTVDPNTGAFVAELTVSVPLGNVKATEFRIRRVVDGGTDVNAMPVIAKGAVQNSAAGRGMAVHEDRGASGSGALSLPLQPWIRYVCGAEVRGPSEPGAGPSANWSTPSTAVAHLFVPPNPPLPAEVVSLTSLGGGQVELRFTHPDPLRGALSNGYALEVYRQLPGQRASLFQTIVAGSLASEGGRDKAGEFHVIDSDAPPPTAAYSVVVRDPLGRRSLATPPAFVTESPDA